MLKRLRMSREEFSEFSSMYIPMFVEQILMSGITMYITTVVKGSGMQAVAAVNLLTVLAMLFQQVFSAMGVGVTVVIAQFRGRGDSTATGSAASQSMVLVVLISLCVSLGCYIFIDPLLAIVLQNSEPLVYTYGKVYLSYYIFSLPFIAIYMVAAAALRGSGHPRISLWVTLIKNGTYAATASASVYLLNAGLEGVGVSLLASSALAAAVGLVLLWRGNANMKIQRLQLKIQRSVVQPVFRVGAPLLLEFFFFQGGRLITQAFAVSYGTMAMAANGIANNIHTFAVVPGMAVANAAQAIVSRYCGQGDLDGAKRKGEQLLLISAMLVTLSSLITWLVLNPLTSLMTDVPEVQKQVYMIISSSCIAVPLIWANSFVTPAILRSSGDGKFASLVCTASMLLMRITTGYILARVLNIGIIGIWLAMYGDWLVRLIFFYPRFKSGKWLQFKVLD